MEDNPPPLPAAFHKQTKEKFVHRADSGQPKGRSQSPAPEPGKNPAESHNKTTEGTYLVASI